ncbi:hypothetical protein L6452_26299 [Arctium lappa]|uniref:Uncharacterized protein n=1 Tax=Arctium lappa TaxID=4217 RepID=A0ACB9ADF4_ARCLA|nr:hypothetical protein L6452_26299 [Arctium lappa]
MMSRDLLSMGSKSKPPVLQADEYPQWRKRMINFLNNKDKKLMNSITNGPHFSHVTVARHPATETIPEIPETLVAKDPIQYSDLDRELVERDAQALTFLIMAIPNDIFNRADNRESTKDIWDELEKQYNIILNDSRRNGVQKYESEINFKFIKNLQPEWDVYTIQMQINKDIDEEKLNDLFCALNQHEEKVKEHDAINNELHQLKDKQKKVEDSLALLVQGKGKLIKGSLVSAKASKKKALMSSLIKSSESSEEDVQEESEDDELTEFAKKLAMLTSSFHKKFGRKKFYNKPKYDSYKSSKYKDKFEKEKEKKE